jgi:hypothetical protein
MHVASAALPAATMQEYDSVTVALGDVISTESYDSENNIKKV